MKPTLYLHIGCHRTATTSIQAFLDISRWHLLDRGILVPFGVGRHNHQLLAILEGKVDARTFAHDLLARATSRSKPVHSVVLSDEDVSMSEQLNSLEGFKDFFDVKVIFSLRRQDEWLESWYFQNVKWQWIPELAHATFPEFMSHIQTFHWINYDRYVQMLESVFGRDNILLTLFERERMPGGPIAAFAKLIGVDDLRELPDAPYINEALSTEITEFVRHLPLDTLEDPERDLVVGLIQQIDQKNRRGSRQSATIMPPEQRKEILEYYKEGNEALARRYFCRDALFSEKVPGPEDPVDELQLPKTSQELITKYVAPLLIALAKAPPPPERIAAICKSAEL